MRSIFKSRNFAKEIAKNYEKMVCQAYKKFCKNFPDLIGKKSYSIPIIRFEFKEKKAITNFKPEEPIFYTDCQNKAEFYEVEKLVLTENLKKDCWYAEKEFGEVKEIVHELEKIGFKIFWKFDEDHNNYVLYPVVSKVHIKNGTINFK